MRDWTDKIIERLIFVSIVVWYVDNKDLFGEVIIVCRVFECFNFWKVINGLSLKYFLNFLPKEREYKTCIFYCAIWWSSYLQQGIYNRIEFSMNWNNDDKERMNDDEVVIYCMQTPKIET